MDLQQFLRTRGICEETIDLFLKENIDIVTILIMEEDDLTKFIPKYGDRIALLSYCKKNTKTQKQSLVEKLKIKLKQKSNKKLENSGSIPEKKPRKKKITRIIEIGWLYFQPKEKRYRQVRTNYGGGTRRISIEQDLECKHILDKAKQLFFPNGESTKGNIDLFETDLFDYKNHKCDLDLTVREMYDISALTTLRFYLASSLKPGVICPPNEDEYIPAIVTSSALGRDHSVELFRVDVNNNSSNSLISTNCSNENFDSVIESTPRRSSRLLNPSAHELSGLEPNAISSASELAADPDAYGNYDFLELTSNIYELPEAEDGSYEKIILHRGRVFEELIEIFQLRNINFQMKMEMVLPNGEPEQAEDIGGVFRDALSEFWNTLYDKVSVGTDYKVPFLRHDFSEEHWKAIGKVLVRGWYEQNYFPIKLAPVFIKSCLNQEILEQELFENFLLFISQSEAEILRTALNNFQETDLNEIMDFCESYGSRCIPSKENLKKLVYEIAHNELIQKPAFVAKQFFHALQNTSIDLDNIYIQFKPTAKNILNSVELETELTEKTRCVFGYLKRFIKDVDENTRSAFLRFCTGSNICNKNIKIHIVERQDGLRGPIAHTCAYILELPASYESYVAFRNEINAVLKSDVWIMDLV